MRYAYAARIQLYPEEAVVTFRDLPEAIAGGSTREDALAEAEGVLETAMWYRQKYGHDIPAPSAAELGEVLVSASPQRGHKD